ncbi:hypothetical protein Goarm_000493 [Gossypium armourianum]|uniref:RING-type E3 ubiquitin transferase n=1 Tax=Gossypium armourianum TaxID=34283 RepID=A0A7J9KA66_9ROSI|nr:hypothetical protein [Gossypium armourianum]
MSHWVLSRGINCKALPLRSVIQASIVDHYNDGILMGRAIAESESEFENVKNGFHADHSSSRHANLINQLNQVCKQSFISSKTLLLELVLTENINVGMVLAKESLVKEMLKTVRIEVGDEEDCMICLEELEVGFDAFRMPCSHTFHGDCIEKWLRHGHCCPICRFKIPAN